MDIKKTMNWKKFAWQAFLVLSVPLALAPMVLCVMGMPMGSDDAFYLSTVERIAEGKMLYKDVATGYNPLWFYMMLGLKWLFHIPVGCIEAYRAFHFVIQLLSAFFLFKIIRCFEINWRIAYFCSWLFVMNSHWAQGNELDLEVSTAMFGLFAIWMVMINTKADRICFFIAGIAASCSFLCKQYGLGFFFLCLFLMLFWRKSGGIRILVFVLGFSFPVLMCYAIWGYDLITMTLLNGYGTTIDESYGRGADYKMGMILSGSLFFFKRVAPASLVTLLFVPLIVREKKTIMAVFCWLGILGFLLQFWFNTEPHYTLLILPFAIILYALVISLLPKAKKIISVLFLVALLGEVSYSVYADYHNRIGKLYMHPEYQQSMERLSDEVKRRIPEGATLYIPNGGLYFVYYQTNITPPNLSTIGYAYGGAGLTVDGAFKQTESADYVLSYDWEQAEPYYTKELKAFIYSHEEVYVDTTWNVVLHDMSRLKEK